MAGEYKSEGVLWDTQEDFPPSSLQKETSIKNGEMLPYRDRYSTWQHLSAMAN